MSTIFHYYNPVRIEFGEGSIQKLSYYLKGRKAILITSNGFSVRGNVAHLLETNKEIVCVYDKVKPNPTLKQVKDFFELGLLEDIEVIVALGGGSVIDFAKAVSFSKKGKFSYKTFYQVLTGIEKDELNYIPIIGIPTTAGTSSELTPWGTIWDDENKVKHSIHTDSLWCETAIYDPELTYSLPKNLTVQTSLDALSHSLESIWNSNRNPLSEQYAIEAIKIIISNLELLSKDLSNKELRYKMMDASMKSGLAFSNTQTSIAHAMSYYLTLHHKIPHGIAASITLADITKIALKEKYIAPTLYQALGQQPSEVLVELFNKLDISTSLYFYGVEKSELVSIKESLLATDRIKNSIVDVDELFELFNNKY